MDFEELGQAELEELGASNVIPVYRGLRFRADKESLYAINYQSRLVSRVLAPLDRFNCHNTDYLYRRAGNIDWSDFLSVDKTFAVYSNVGNSAIRHSKYAALRLKDAIVDYFREREGARPSVNRLNPDVWFNVDIHDNIATINLETSGGAMHRRGYRKSTGSAPIQETAAAAIVRMTGWEGERKLIDPMCGSGTLIAEALMSYCRIPASFLRKNRTIESMPDFDSGLWSRVRQTADSRIRNLPPGLIVGSDIDSRVLADARKNLAALPGGASIHLESVNWRNIESITDATIVTNPPYGRRLNTREPIGDFYKSFGDFLKQRCTGL